MNFENLKDKELSVIYITTKTCSVCKSIYPKLQEVIAPYDKLQITRFEMDENPEVSGAFMIFSVPALMIYSKGRELYRAARFLDLQEISHILEKHYYKKFKDGIQ